MSENEKAKVLELNKESIERLKTDPMWVDRGAQIWMDAQTAKRMSGTPMGEVIFDVTILQMVTIFAMNDLDTMDAIVKSDVAATFAEHWVELTALANELQSIWAEYVEAHTGDCETCEDKEECDNRRDTPPQETTH